MQSTQWVSFALLGIGVFVCCHSLCCPFQPNVYELQKSTFLGLNFFHCLKKLCGKQLVEINDLCREELLEQTQVSKRYESRAKDLKTLLDSSNDKLQVYFTLDREIFVRNLFPFAALSKTIVILKKNF